MLGASTLPYVTTAAATGPGRARRRGGVLSARIGPMTKYLPGAAALVGALALWHVLGKQLSPSPLPLLLTAVLVAGVYGGRRASLLSAAVATLASWPAYFAMLPAPALGVGAVRLAVFAAAAMAVTVLTGRLRDARDAAEIARSRAEAARAEAEAAREEAETARAQAESARDAAAQFRILVEGVEDCAIFLLDEAGRVATWNPGAARITGYRAAQIVGRPHAAFFMRTEQDAGAPEAALRRAAEVGGSREEGWRVRVDGTRFWADTAITVLRDAHGDVRGYAEVVRDLTERRREQDERAAFMAALAHDVKNPLAVVKGIAQLLRLRAGRDQLTPAVLDARLAAIDSAVGQAAGRITELLDLARTASGRALEVERTPTDLVALVHRAAAAQQAGTEAHRISVDARATTLTGSWDGARLERAVENLLANAVKYSPGGGVVRIALRTRRVGGGGRAWAVLRVRDAGMGIPAEDLSRVFDPFARAANAASLPGSGLGLASVRHIVEQHGGVVRIASREGSGTAVSVYLPLDAPHPAGGRPTLALATVAGAA